MKIEFTAYEIKQGMRDVKSPASFVARLETNPAAFTRQFNTLANKFASGYDLTYILDDNGNKLLHHLLHSYANSVYRVLQKDVAENVSNGKYRRAS